MNRIFNKERCTGCGICTIYCPMEILEISNNTLSNGVKAISSIIDESKCTNCMICERMCPYLAIAFKNETATTFPKLMEGINIPFHNGCFQGIIEKLIAESIEELIIEKHIVIFKP